MNDSVKNLLKNKNFLIILIIFSISFGFRLWGIHKQFEVWDETAVVRNGELYLNNWLNRDFSEDAWLVNKEHPPFSKYFYGGTRFISLKIPFFTETLDQEYPLGRRYSFQRMISAIIGSLSVVIVYLFINKFYKRKDVAILGALILSFTPYFLAHSKVATQENLVTFLTLLATYLYFLGLKTHDLKSKYFLISAIILGFAISTKYNAIFFLILYALLALITFYKDFKDDFKKLFLNYIILIPIISFLVLYLIWPWLWPNPIERFLASSNRIAESSFNEYFLGIYPSPHPWYYFFVYFIATTPIVLLIGLILFLFKSLKNRIKYDIWFLLYFLTPFLSSFSPLKLDGIRYIFPIYPALAIVTAVGYYHLSDNISKFVHEIYENLYQKTIPIIVISILVFTSILYHPYYWDFYNVLVGGPSNVSNNRLFDFGYWGEGYRKGFEYLRNNANDGDTLYVKIIPVHVIPEFSEDLIYIEAIEHANYVIINPTGEWLDKTNYLTYDFPEHFDLVYEDRVINTPILQIYKRNAPYEE